MAKRGGFPGGMGMGNMNNLMKQAQKMQRQMEESQKELERWPWQQHKVSSTRFHRKRSGDVKRHIAFFAGDSG